jgi:hypothetical protein
MKSTALLLLFVSFISLGGTPAVSSPNITPEARRILTEAEAKAAFVLNFARFTEWPEGKLPQGSRAIRIGVMGESPVLDELQRLSKDFTIQGHPVEVVTIGDPQDEVGCQVVFILDVEHKMFLRYLEKIEDQEILIVGDEPEMAGWGASVAFQPMKTRLQFVVNRKAASAHHLTFSSQLLKLEAKILD